MCSLVWVHNEVCRDIKSPKNSVDMVDLVLPVKNTRRTKFGKFDDKNVNRFTSVSIFHLELLVYNNFDKID